jgi:chromosome segregation ATPase
MEDLPKALSAVERCLLIEGDPDSCDRALSLIDAMTATMAEQAAQIVTDGQRIAELERELSSHKDTVMTLDKYRVKLESDLQSERDRRVEHRQMNQSLNEQVQQFRTTVVSLTQDLERERASVLEAGGDAQALSLAVDGYKQKLAAADALLSDALDALNQDVWTVLAAGIRAHLAGQTAAPSRTEAERSVLSAIDAAPERVVREWVKAPAGIVGFYHDLGVAELARRGLK